MAPFFGVVKPSVYNPVLSGGPSPGEYSAVSDPLYAAAGATPALDLKLAENGNFTDAISGNDLVTFSRSAASSPGTYVGSDGLIKTAAVNLLLYSEQFDISGSWTSVGTTIVANAGTSPVGTTTAEELFFTATGGIGSATARLFQLLSGISSGNYTASVYVKASTSSLVYFRKADNTPGPVYDLTDGSLVAGDDTGFSVSFAGDGWYRVSTTAFCSSAALLYLANGSSVVPSGSIYVWGAQLEEGTVATPYIKTTSQSLAAPRFDYDPVSLKPLGLLVEEARTNRNPYSQDFSTWTILSGVTDTPNAGTSPDGQNNATRITSSAAQTSFSSNNRIYYGSLSPVDSLKSIFVKADTHDQVAMRHSGSNNQGVYFDLTAGTATPYGASSPTVYGMKQYSDGWWRVWIRTNDYLMLSVYNAIGSVYVWGAQEEELVDTATSYIPTSGTSLSRAADLASIVGADFTSWYNASEGTTYVQYEVDDKPAGSRKNSHSFYTLPVTRVMESGWRSAGGSADYGFAIVNTRVITSTQDPAANTFFKEATAYDPGNYAYAIDGVADTSSSATVPGTADAFYLGASQTQFIINGHIKRLAYWDTRISDANLGAMTS